MTKNEHLLTTLSEECSEVAKCVSKSLRFGLNEVQPGHLLNNSDRIKEEFLDLVAVYEMCIDAGIIDHSLVFDATDYAAMAAKKAKVTEYMNFSIARGLIFGEEPTANYRHPEAKE